MYLSLKVPDSVVYVRLADHPLSGILLSLSVIVMLGVGNECLYTDCVLDGCNELLDCDLVGERDHPVSSINRVGGHNIRPNLILISSVSSFDGEAVLSGVLCSS